MRLARALSALGDAAVDTLPNTCGTVPPMTNDLRQFELEDVNGLPFRFDGRVLVDVTSYRAGKPRWIEIRIYETRAGTIITELVGNTSIVGETIRARARTHDSPHDAIMALHNNDSDTGEPYITAVARDAITIASEKHPGIATAWENMVRQVA